MKSVLSILLTTLFLSCQAYDPSADPNAEVKQMAVDQSTAQQYAEQRQWYVNMISRDILRQDSDFDVTFGEITVGGLDSDETDRVEKLFEGINEKRSRKIGGVGYYRYMKYKDKDGKRSDLILIVEDEAAYCMDENEESSYSMKGFSAAIKEEIVQSHTSPDRKGKHGILSLEFTNQALPITDTGYYNGMKRKSSLAFGLDTNVVFIRRPYKNSCKQLEVIVEHGDSEVQSTVIDFEKATIEKNKGQLFYKSSDYNF